MNNYEPDWIKYLDTSDVKFWDKVRELKDKGVKCNCGNRESEGYMNCTICFLPFTDKDYDECWVWSPPRRSADRWLCYPVKFYNKMINFKTDDSNGAIIMAQTRAKVWELMRWYFYEIQDRCCVKCCEFTEINLMELHHKIAKCNGGREDEYNLEMLCKRCHRSKMMEIYND